MNFEPTPHELAALRDGRLGLILRPVVPQPPPMPDPEFSWSVACVDGVATFHAEAIARYGFDHPDHVERHEWDRLTCPLGQPGDVLAVREEWYYDGGDTPTFPIDPSMLDYQNTHRCSDWEAGCPCRDDEGRSMWQPAETMPDWAARYHMRRVGEARCLRLQELSPADIMANGAPGCAGETGLRVEFALHWGDLHTDEALTYDRNPYVWAVSVEVAS